MAQEPGNEAGEESNNKASRRQCAQDSDLVMDGCNRRVTCLHARQHSVTETEQLEELITLLRRGGEGRGEGGGGGGERGEGGEDARR